MKILVVDDEKFNLVIARDLLEVHVDNQGIILCKEPVKVMEILATEDVGIVLLDIVMPKLDGISLLKLIRSEEKYQDLQVVMFTGLSDKESFRQCFEYGANDYINKPIDPTEFVVRMQAADKTRKNILKLKQTQAYLVQAEKLMSLGELAAGVAHEINNPVGFINSNLETMAKYLDKAKDIIEQYRKLGQMVLNADVTREDLILCEQQILEHEHDSKLERVLADFTPIITESRDGVERVAKIVQSLRNFARSGNENEIMSNDLNQIVEDALMIMKNEIKYVAVVEKTLASVNPVLCDKGQVAQVLINILHNAVQAIKGQNRGEMGKIAIETYLEDKYVVCRITDDGPGIKPDYLKRIFDPFFTTKEVGSGTGLGLSIAYGIIKKFAGELLVESIYGAGAAFTIKLPK
jgi:two-component system, NtrC family, sensor kinase